MYHIAISLIDRVQRALMTLQPSPCHLHLSEYWHFLGETLSLLQPGCTQERCNFRQLYTYRTTMHNKHEQQSCCHQQREHLDQTHRIRRYGQVAATANNLCHLPITSLAQPKPMPSSWRALLRIMLSSGGDTCIVSHPSRRGTHRP